MKLRIITALLTLSLISTPAFCPPKSTSPKSPLERVKTQDTDIWKSSLSKRPPTPIKLTAIPPKAIPAPKPQPKSVTFNNTVTVVHQRTPVIQPEDTPSSSLDVLFSRMQFKQAQDALEPFEADILPLFEGYATEWNARKTSDCDLTRRLISNRSLYQLKMLCHKHKIDQESAEFIVLQTHAALVALLTDVIRQDFFIDIQICALEFAQKIHAASLANHEIAK